MALSLRIATQLKATATSDASLAMGGFFFFENERRKGDQGIDFLSFLFLPSLTDDPESFYR